jgi:hypothetical protein
MRLAERYGARRVDAACARALAFELLDVRRVERIVRAALERAPARPRAASAGRRKRTHDRGRSVPLKGLCPVYAQLSLRVSWKQATSLRRPAES